MTNHFSFTDPNLLAGILALLGGLLTFLAIVISVWRKKLKKHIQNKITYVKVIHLTKKTKDHKPVYEAYVRRLKSYIPVFDESHFFRLIVFHSPPGNLTVTDRSSGTVDAIMIDPWQEELYFTDVGAAKIHDFLSQNIEVKTNIFFSKSMYYNGLQKGNEDVAIKMDLDTDMARIIVDFSSIPGFKDIMAEPPMATLVPLKKGTVESLGVGQLQSGIYNVCKNNLKKDDVIRMNFFFDWKMIEQNSSQINAVQKPATPD